MGPTNIALVKLFRADQALREAQERLDAASKNVRVQERRVNDLLAKQKAAQQALMQAQSRAAQHELDLKTRDAHIEKLRNQQQTARTNKEYQTFLIEINTAKVDRSKVEDEALKAVEAVEKAQQEVAGLATGVESERAKLQTLKDQSESTVAALTSEVNQQQPARDEAAKALPPKALAAFERLAEHHDGEALSAIARPDRRREEYVCTACNMDLVTDVYNKLHSRDELVFCPSCRRILYIPEDLPVDQAVKKATPKPTITRAPRVSKSRGAAVASTTVSGTDETGSPVTEVVIEQRAKGKLGEALTKAQGETVRSANAAGETPVECEVFVGGELAGIYKGQTPQQLERAVKFYLGEYKIEGDVRVSPVPQEVEPAPADAPGASSAEAPVVPPTDPAPAEPMMAGDAGALPQAQGSESQNG